MDRETIYGEIKETLGLVPSFFKEVPDSLLEMEWGLFKKIELDAGPIPNKYRELLGIAISAVSKCRYCVFFHTEVAKLHGATDEEIEAAVHYAKSSAGWSAYVNGLQIDYDVFKEEVGSVCKFLRSRETLEG